MPSRYTDQEKIEAFLQRDLTDREAVMVDYIITTVSETVKSYTGRNWKDLGATAETEEETRVYNGNGSRELFIDDFEELTKIEFLDSLGNLYEEIVDTDYLTYPSGVDIGSSLYLRGRRFPLGASNIRVTGKFTSGPVPDYAIMAATKLAALEISGQGDQSQTMKSESIEGYSYTVGDNSSMESKETVLASLPRKIIF